MPDTTTFPAATAAPTTLNLAGVFAAGFSAVSTGFRIEKHPSGLVVFSGYVQKSSLLVGGETILTLPVGWRPLDYQEYPAVAGHSNPGATYAVMRVDIDQSGVAVVTGVFPPPAGGSSPAYLSLGSVVFPTT